MSTEPELSAQIAALGEQIKAAKAASLPPAEWNETLQQMLRLKKEYQTLTGHDFGKSPSQEKNKEKKAQSEEEEGSEKKKEKRAAKAAAKAAR